jgi:transcriptional regulator with XRE-family HTH domain
LARQTNDQIPLGELLLNARLEKRLSRADVAKLADISENSLVRYERAGIDDDGQFPPSPKLAQLCFTLELNPLTVLLSCLGYREYWREKGELWEREFMMKGHPDYEYLQSEVFRLMKENAMLKSALRTSFKIEDEELTDETRDILLKRVRDFLVQEASTSRDLLHLGAFPDTGGFSTPGIPLDRWEEAHPGAPRSGKYLQWAEENGPDQKDLGRSLEQTKPNEAASTASQSKPLRRKQRRSKK